MLQLDFAIRKIHFPDTFDDVETARKRLAFEELLILQLGMARLKSGRRDSGTAANRIVQDYSQELFSMLPFEPTGAQKRAVSECIADMSSGGSPMNRLVQGDVGSGKTAVAAAVCYSAVKNNMQCAFMAPTEILAAQHYNSLSQLLLSCGIKVELLTGSVKQKEKKKLFLK